MPITTMVIPCNNDNFSYIIRSRTQSGKCCIVDVSNCPDLLIGVMAKENLVPTHILTTHKHLDHAGGNNAMLVKFPDLSVIGSSIDKCEGVNHVVSDNEVFSLWNEIKVTPILSPGHTMGHMCYHCLEQESSDNNSVVFTGDMLFIGGVGKFFEGSAKDIYPGLLRLLALPRHTLVWCGHEYTLSNYRFALSIDADNQDLIAANEAAKKTRAENRPTVPSSIEFESKTNPFLRVSDKSISDKFPECGGDPIAILSAVREAKNNFK